MKPELTPTDDLLPFQAHFDQLLNPRHPLIKLARQIDWDTFDQQFGELIVVQTDLAIFGYLLRTWCMHGGFHPPVVRATGW